MPSEWVNEKNINSLFQVVEQLQRENREQVERITRLEAALAGIQVEMQKLSEQVMGLLVERAKREAP